jgi:hypothetical protein
MVWGCISHDCKLDLVTIQGNLTADQYIRDVLQPVGVPHFDNHPGLCIWKMYFCVSKPSSGRRLHEAETGSRLTNGSCAMSLDSNHVVLNTTPNVFVDVGLPTVDVLPLYCSQPTGEKTHKPTM